jgi:hypothetical protein
VHTVKTLGPVFTIAFARLLLGERLPLSRCVAVAPVVLGVALTSITEAEFTMVAFLAILLSTAAQALQSVVAKRLLREREVGKSELFALAALHAFAMLLPLSLILDAWRIHRAPSPAARRVAPLARDRPLAITLHACLSARAGRPLSHAQAVRVVRWLLLNGACSAVNQYSGLSVLDAMSSPLSHALANVIKRATVITAAMIYQARPVTPLHLCGVALSVFGACGYQSRGLCGDAEHGELSDGDASASGSYELVPLTQPSSGGVLVGVEGKGSKDNSETTAGGSDSSCASTPVNSPPESPCVQPHGGMGGSPRARGQSSPTLPAALAVR